MDDKQLEEVLMDFLKDKNVKTAVFNGKVFVDKKEVLSTIIKSIDETLQAGDIALSKSIRNMV